MFRCPLLLFGLHKLGVEGRTTCSSDASGTCKVGLSPSSTEAVLLQHTSVVHEGILETGQAAVRLSDWEVASMATSDETVCYGELPALAVDEGAEVGKVSTTSAADCKRGCSGSPNCKSMSFCPGWRGCWLKSKAFEGGEASKAKADCKTFFRKPCTRPPTPAPTPTPTPQPAPLPAPVPPPIPSASLCYGELAGLASDEGGAVGTVWTQSASECKRRCSESDQCKSVSFCRQWSGCWLKDRTLSGGEATQLKSDCKTLYKKQCDDSRGPVPPPPNAPAAGGKIKVVSYNLYWWNAFGQNPWKGQQITDNIKNRLQADVIGLQECDNPGLIEGRTGYKEASPFAGAQGTMVKSGLFDVGDTGAQDIGAAGKWGPRYVTWAELTHKASGRTFWHFNTHWCVHNGNGRTCGPGKRYAGAKNMLQIIREKARQAPVIITGDFNAAMSEAGPRHFLQNGFSLAKVNWVDAIFYSNDHWKPSWTGVGDAAHSDHPPVIAELEFM